MPAPDIALVKVFARIDGAEHDATLPMMIASATVLAGHECGVDYTVEAMPEAVQQWVASNVAYWIDNPQAATERQMNRSPFVDRLLDPYRSYYQAPAA